ncbi:hypothetical protein GGF41_000616 [Coemansia sp. RSA 2531]|nr:hypothetical protein GGF41_000616 [Coemansia sp. RSA 2531]
MYSSTPFQFLPPHVVSLIVKYVVGSTPMCSRRDVEGLKALERPLIPLLWVCHNFREVVHSRFFCECTLDIADGEDGDGCEVFEEWPSSPLAPANHTYHLARNLVIELNARSIFSGEALQVLSAAPYEGVVFPQVRKLTVILFFNTWREGRKYTCDSLQYNIARNINEFIQRVKQMAPATNKVAVENRFDIMNGRSHGVSYCRVLVTLLPDIAGSKKRKGSFSVRSTENDQAIIASYWPLADVST